MANQPKSDWSDTDWNTVMFSMRASNDYEFQLSFPLWLNKNKYIWSAFVTMTRTAYAAGHRERFSARIIVERIRWETLMQDAGSKMFKVNHNYAPDMARLVMSLKKDMKGFFKINDRELEK